MYFVWIKGFQHPEAQIWNEKLVDGNGKPKPYLFIKELAPYEENCSLNTLSEMYENELSIVIKQI